MADNRIKILFVVSEFYRSGAERYAYEIDQIIDKSRFSIDILSLLPLNNNKNWEDYYYEKHVALGTPIYFLKDIDITPKPSVSQRINRILFKKPLPHEHQPLRDFLDKYDCISFMGGYTFPIISRWMTPAQIDKTLIHVHTSRYQKPDAYVRYDKNHPFHFVTTFDEGEAAWELSEFKSYKHSHFPYSINMEALTGTKKYTQSAVKKIGIFTRLTVTKPLDPFIYSFHLMVNQQPNIEFHIYGNGDPEAEGVMRYVKQLGLEDKIFFRGHQENLVQTALDENLDLVWLHGYHGIPGGFASFDICTTGIPQIFWNFGTHDTKKINYDLFPMYNDLLGFANKSLEILQNEDVAKFWGDKQFEYNNDKRNIKKQIHLLEAIYSEHAKK